MQRIILTIIIFFLLVSSVIAAETQEQFNRKFGIGYYDNGLDLVYWKNNDKGIQINLKLSMDKLTKFIHNNYLGGREYNVDNRISVAFLKKLKEYNFMQILMAYGISYEYIKEYFGDAFNNYELKRNIYNIQIGPMIEVFMPFLPRLCLTSGLKLNIGYEIGKYSYGQDFCRESISISGTGFTIDTFSIRYYF